MRCQDIMVEPVECARIDERAGDVARRMRDENIGFMPVCDAGGRAVGALTDRDLAVRALADGMPDAPAGALMTPLVVACRRDDDLAHVDALMREHQVERILVTDERDVPVGVISLADLAQIAPPEAGEILRLVSDREVRGAERPPRFAPSQRRMVEEQLVARGFADPAVLRAILAVPRAAFVPRALAAQAHADAPVSAAEGSVVPTAFEVATVAAALRLGPRDRVLEIGTGAGYRTAVLAALAGEVWSLAESAASAEAAARLLRSLGLENVRVVAGRVASGLPERAPFDAIVAGEPRATIPDSFLEQLALGGRLILEVPTPGGGRRALRVTRTGELTFRREVLDPPGRPAGAEVRP
jgi:protein-L-isoaspartate(D-aspartate) O-methyltransferase